MARKTKVKEEDVIDTVPQEFTPCSQCGHTGDCARAGKCVKGFK